MIRKKVTIFALIFGLYFTLSAHEIAIVYDPAIPTISFAADHLKKALSAHNHTVLDVNPKQLSSVTSPVRIILTTYKHPAAQPIIHHPGLEEIPELDPQGYSMRVENGAGYVAYWIIGGDDQGAMYGGLDLTEVAQAEGSILHLRR